MVNDAEPRSGSGRLSGKSWPKYAIDKILVKRLQIRGIIQYNTLCPKEDLTPLWLLVDSSGREC